MRARVCVVRVMHMVCMYMFLVVYTKISLREIHKKLLTLGLCGEGNWVAGGSKREAFFSSPFLHIFEFCTM